LPTKKEGRT